MKVAVPRKLRSSCLSAGEVMLMMSFTISGQEVTLRDHITLLKYRKWLLYVYIEASTNHLLYGVI